HYAPPNVVVAAAGKLEHTQILDLVRRHFADLPAQVPPGMENGTYQGGEFREDRDLDQVHIVLGFPSVGYSDPDYYPTLLLSTVLGGGMSSRLFQEIREKRGLVYSIYSFAQPYMDGGLFGIYAGTGESEAEELMPVTLEELRKVQTSVTEVELARAKAQVKASVLMSLESTGSRCEQLARQIQVFGRVLTTEETVRKIMAVTAQDVQRSAGRHFRGKPTLAAMGPANRVPGLTSIAESLLSSQPSGHATAASWALIRPSMAGTASAPFILARIRGTSGAGTGRLNRKPCTSAQPSFRSRQSCSSVSTPSATVVMPRPRLSAVMARTISLVPPSRVMPATNDRSILILSNGNLCR